METTREELLTTLEAHYRGSGWRVQRGDDSTVFADGPGGVTWIGRAVVAADLDDDGVEERLRELAERRMDGGGELCPFELLPAADCKQRLEELLSRIGIADRGNVAVYSFVA
jgi:hypothetical protein